MANKVEFGINNLYVGTYEVDSDGVVSMGKPLRIAGAVSYSPEEQGDNNTFYADNTAYYSAYSTGTFEGDLEVALFPDAFKTGYLGFVKLDDGGIAQIKNAARPSAYIMFEVEGDAEKRRVIFYNVTFGNLTREYNTTEDSIEVATETIATTVTGDNATGISKVTYDPDASGYETLFDNPPAPALPSE